MSSSTAANHAASFTLYWLAPAWIWSRLDLVHGSPSGLRLPHETATARPDFRFLPPALLPVGVGAKVSASKSNFAIVGGAIGFFVAIGSRPQPNLI